MKPTEEINEKFNTQCSNCNAYIDDVNETDTVISEIKVVLLSDFDDYLNMYCNSFIKIEDKEVVVAGRKKGDVISFSVPVGDYEIIVGNDIFSKVKTLNISAKANKTVSVGIKSTLLSYDFFCC